MKVTVAARFRWNLNVGSKEKEDHGENHFDVVGSAVESLGVELGGVSGREGRQVSDGVDGGRLDGDQRLESVELVEDGSVGGVLGGLLAWSTGALEPSVNRSKSESGKASVVGDEASFSDTRRSGSDGGQSGLAISLDGVNCCWDWGLDWDSDSLSSSVFSFEEEFAGPRTVDGLKNGLAGVWPDSVLGKDVLNAALVGVEWRSDVLEVAVERDNWGVSLDKVDPRSSVQHSVAFNWR